MLFIEILGAIFNIAIIYLGLKFYFKFIKKASDKNFSNIQKIIIAIVGFFILMTIWRFLWRENLFFEIFL